MSEMGERIKSLRLRCGLTQKDLAAQLGLAASTVGMYEQNRRVPETASVVSMAVIFGASTDYILGVNSPAPVPLLSPEQEQLLSSYALLDPGDQGVVRGEISGMLRAEKYTSAAAAKKA